MKVGSVVANRLDGRGRIMARYDSFDSVDCIDDKPLWLALQIVPVTVEQQQEPWYSVSLFGGGNIVCCESSLEIIQQAEEV